MPRGRRAGHDKTGPGRPSARKSVRKVGRRRVRAAAAVVAVAGLLLSGRAVHLSVANDERYQALAAEQVADVTPGTGPQRGDIISADGRKLATSLEAANIIATPYQINNPEEDARRLADVIGPSTGLSADEIQTALTRRDAGGAPSGYSVVAAGVEPGVAEKVRALGIEGIVTTPDAVRVYPDGKLASQLTGYLGDYGEAFGGVEARYDEALKSGKDVTLTLDSAVQQQLQGEVASAVKEYHAKSGLGLVMRAKDGAIVALANTPGYNNNNFDEASVEEQRNRVLTDPYEPGSTFKAFTMSAALERGTVTQDDEFKVPDHIKVADVVIHDSLPHRTETMTPAKILQESSNVGTIKIARNLGGKHLCDYIRRFGFGEATGVDLWGENAGTVPAHKDWSGSTIGNVPIGQGLTVTPLQLAAGYATIANGGLKVTPHVAQETSPTPPGPRVISEQTSSIVGNMLQSVVEKGTGTYAQIPGYTVAGKTGTSQQVDPKTGTYGDSYVASFVGFAPATDPKYVALVVVDDPKGDIWGESVAAPAFQKVMGFTLEYFNVHPDDPKNGGTG